MGRAVAGKRRSEGGRPQVLPILLLVFLLPFVSCAVSKPSEPQRRVSKTIASSFVEQKKRSKTA